MIKLINTDGKHNKFWSAETNSDYTVTCKWGRVGTTGQSKSFPHGSEWAAESFIDKKSREKCRKGYEQVEDKTYGLHVFRSKLVGAGAKIHNIFWVKPMKITPVLAGRAEGRAYKEVKSANEIANPEYDPMIYADIRFTGNRGQYHLLITTDSVCYTENNAGFGIYGSELLDEPGPGWTVVLNDLQPITEQSPQMLRNLRDKADGMVHSLL